MPEPTINYPLDVTGVNPTNLIVNEFHAITPLRRGVVMNYGPFFEQGLVVRNAADDALLTPGDDYVVALIYQAATFAIKKAIYCVIVVNNINITGIRVTYQAVGGEYTRFTGAIAELLEEISLDDRPVYWGDLLGTPNGFVPLPHQHAAYQIHSWGALIAAVDRVKTALLVGNQQAIQELYDYVNQQLQGNLAPVASDMEALEGLDAVKRIVPSNLKYVIDERLGDLTLPTFQHEIEQVDDDWGYWYHEQSGFTVCMGSTLAIASGEAYRAFFRRRFTNIPIIVGSFHNSTTDSNSTGAQWVEVTGGIVDHTRSNESFYVAANRINGTVSTNDKVRFNYVAIGYSEPAAPLAVSEGAIGVVPPTGATLEQPTWSGTNAVALQTGPTGTSRFGIVFPSTVNGGGYTFNTVAQDSLSNVYYTNYPGQFVDNDYEIMGSLGTQTYNPNLTYTGLALNTWHDMATVRGMDPTQLGSGFTFTTTGLYGGSVPLTITIRKKTDNSKLASRVINFNRTSTALTPYFLFISHPSIELRSTSSSTKSVRVALEADGGSGYKVVGYNASSQEVFSKTLTTGSFGNTTPLPTSIGNQYELAVRISNPSGNGYTAGAGSNVISNTTFTYYDLDVAVSSSGWIISTQATTSSVINVEVYLRHKTDVSKVHSLLIDLVRYGSDYLPVWSGTTSANVAVPNGSLVKYEIHFPTNMADGQGEIRYAVDGVYAAPIAFTYSQGIGSFSDSNYSVKGSQTSATGNTLTNNGLLGGNPGLTLSTARMYSWQGTITQPTTLSVLMSVARTNYIQYGDMGWVDQSFTFNVTLS